MAFDSPAPSPPVVLRFSQRQRLFSGLQCPRHVYNRSSSQPPSQFSLSPSLTSPTALIFTPLCPHCLPHCFVGMPHMFPREDLHSNALCLGLSPRDPAWTTPHFLPVFAQSHPLSEASPRSPIYNGNSPPARDPAPSSSYSLSFFKALITLWLTPWFTNLSILFNSCLPPLKCNLQGGRIFVLFNVIECRTIQNNAWHAASSLL